MAVRVGTSLLEAHAWRLRHLRQRESIAQAGDVVASFREYCGRLLFL
jgi:hypothetical protein